MLLSETNMRELFVSTRSNCGAGLTIAVPCLPVYSEPHPEFGPLASRLLAANIQRGNNPPPWPHTFKEWIDRVSADKPEIAFLTLQSRSLGHIRHATHASTMLAKGKRLDYDQTSPTQQGRISATFSFGRRLSLNVCTRQHW